MERRKKGRSKGEVPMTQCLSCEKLDLQKYPKHSAQGIGKCKHEQLEGVFVSIAHHRQCNQFEAADAEIAQKRITWWESRKGK